MSDEDLTRIESKLDRVLEVLPKVQALVEAEKEASDSRNSTRKELVGIFTSREFKWVYLILLITVVGKMAGMDVDLLFSRLVSLGTP